MKIAFLKYLALDFLFAYFIVCGYTLHVGFMMEEPERTCLTGGINNYLEFDWNNYFHWFWNKIDNACRFEDIAWQTYNWVLISYYALLKFYGIRHGLNALSFRYVIPELLIYMVMYLNDLTGTNIIWTTGSLLNAMIGFVQLLSPFIIVSILAILGKFIFLKTRLLNLWKKHNKICSCTALIISSSLIFPVLVSLLFCIWVVPVGVTYIYITLPKMLNRIISGSAVTLRSSRRRALILLGIMFFILESYALLFSFPKEIIYQHFFAKFLINLSIHSLYYGIVLSIMSPRILDSFKFSRKNNS